MNRLTLATLATLAVTAAPVRSEVFSRTAGPSTFSVDASAAAPGGFLIVRAASQRSLGTVLAGFEGQRVILIATARGPRALLPVPMDTPPGPNVVGFEVATRRGRQRVPVDVQIAARNYAPIVVQIPEALRPLLARGSVVRDQRELLSLLRTHSLAAPGPLRAPVAAAGDGFGSPQTWVGATAVERLTDGSYSERRRGLIYPCPRGVPVRSPGDGLVLFAGALTLPGQIVVLDHGHGLLSALLHLSRVDVTVGQTVWAGAVLGLTGQSGFAVESGVEWRVYLHGVAVDPRLFDRNLD